MMRRSDAHLAQAVSEAANELADLRVGRFKVQDGVFQSLGQTLFHFIGFGRLFGLSFENALDVRHQLREFLSRLVIKVGTVGQLTMKLGQ